MSGREIPYRGRPDPHYPKPRKQVRDLAAENQQYLFTAVVVAIFGMMVLGGGILVFFQQKDGLVLFVTVVIFASVVIVGLTVLDGLRSINKFREGYDIDISFLVSKEEREEQAKKKYAHHD